jgi:hypothetical protein
MSFAASTAVLLASGKKVPISQLRPGDKVLATSTRTGKTKAEPVAAVLVHYDTDLYNLTVTSGGHTAVIRTTASHLFWNQVTRRWTKASALHSGDLLRTPSGTQARVNAGYTPTVATGTMWDLTVTSDHDFYVVAATTAILVHNCPPRIPGSGGPVAPTLDKAGEAYVRASHFPGGELVDASKSIFNAEEDPYALADAAANAEPVGPNARSFFERDVNAGRIIGNLSQNAGGLPTTWYRVVQGFWGDVRSMHPIWAPGG